MVVPHNLECGQLQKGIINTFGCCSTLRRQLRFGYGKDSVKVFGETDNVVSGMSTDLNSIFGRMSSISRNDEIVRIAEMFSL